MMQLPQGHPEFDQTRGKLRIVWDNVDYMEMCTFKAYWQTMTPPNSWWELLGQFSTSIASPITPRERAAATDIIAATVENGAKSGQVFTHSLGLVRAMTNMDVQAAMMVFKDLPTPKRRKATRPEEGEEPGQMSATEAGDMLLQYIWDMVRYWDGVENYTVRQKLEGLAHSLLVALDGSTLHLPGFKVIPILAEGDIKYAKEHGENWWPEEDIAGHLHNYFYQVEDDHDGSE